MSDLPRLLIVDDSRMVRASLARHLKGVYEVKEEGDGEAAWQTLVLDHTIAAVISDLQMPVLDGFGLLERVRTCKLSRLRDIPFILISGEEDQEVLERAERLGVSDFISKGVTAVELKTRLGHLLQFAQTRQSLEEARAQQVQDAVTGLFTRKYVELQAAAPARQIAVARWNNFIIESPVLVKTRSAVAAGASGIVREGF